MNSLISKFKTAFICFILVCIIISTVLAVILAAAQIIKTSNSIVQAAGEEISTGLMSENTIAQNVSTPDEDSASGKISAISITKDEIEKGGLSFEGYNKSIENQNKIETTGNWSPTDYISGEVIKPTYTVSLGDTLWEIAEGYYGDGSQWIKILEQNSTQIGFLPDGSQALIFEGQTLNL